MDQLELFPAAVNDGDGHFLAWLSSVRFWVAHLPVPVAVRPFEVRPHYNASKSPRQVAELLATNAKFSKADINRFFGLEVHGGY